MAVSNQQLMDKLDRIAEGTEDTNIRLSMVEQSLKKLNEAMYGNGEPGMKERVRDLDRRVHEFEEKGTPLLRDVSTKLDVRIAELEKTHVACPVAKIERIVEDIEDRHVLEDGAKKDKKDDEKAARAERRKFQWTLVMFVVTTVVNLVLTAYGLSK